MRTVLLACLDSTGERLSHTQRTIPSRARIVALLKPIREHQSRLVVVGISVQQRLKFVFGGHVFLLFGFGFFCAVVVFGFFFRFTAVGSVLFPANSSARLSGGNFVNARAAAS